MKEIRESVSRLEGAQREIMKAMEELSGLNQQQDPEDIIRTTRYVTNLLLGPAHGRVR